MKRSEILDEAKRIVCGEREEQYGGPEDNFKLIGRLWTEYISAVYSQGRNLGPAEVADMMILLKIARNVTGEKLDNYIDVCGYAACGGEVRFGKKNTDEDEEAWAEWAKKLPGQFLKKNDCEASDEIFGMVQRAVDAYSEAKKEEG